MKSTSQYSSHFPHTLLSVFYFCFRTLPGKMVPPALPWTPQEHATAQALQLQAAVIQATLFHHYRNLQELHTQKYASKTKWLIISLNRSEAKN